MTSLAQIDDFYHSPPDVAFTVGRFLVTDNHFRRRGAEISHLDTGLRAGIRLEYSGELSPHIEQAIARVAELEQREAGWDSHGGRGLNDRAVHPAFRLIVDGFKMCRHPRIQLNSMGDLALIWETDSRYLEATARADGAYDISFEDSDSGEEFESEAPVGYNVAQEYLTRFCAIP
jgi:hypothetical protein